MLVAGLKRLAQLVGLVLAVALVAAVLGALLLHVPFRRSLSVTCYGLGAFFLVSGFFHGVRPACQNAAYSTFEFDGSITRSIAPVESLRKRILSQCFPPSFER